MNEKITSPQNPFIKKIVDLREAKVRRQEGLIVIDGLREIEMAWNAGVVIERIYYCPVLLRAERSEAKQSLSRQERLLRRFAPRHDTGDSVKIFETSDKVFEKISFGDRKDGLVAIAQMPIGTLSMWPKPKNPLYIVVETLEKPGNLGAILRTAEGAGVSGVIVCEKKTDIYNPNVIRSSLGAVFTVPVTAVSNEDCLKFLRERNVSILATFVSAKNFYTQSNLSKPIAIVLGSEEGGLTDFWNKNSDDKIKIPLLGQIDSLNVSVSAAVVVYEALRQRGADRARP